jgi:microsomal epoxide hydrolase
MTDLPRELPQTRRGDFVTSDGVRLSFLHRGSPAGQASMLLVPGWSMPASIWSEQMVALSNGREVFALDPRGQGESDVPEDGYVIERRAQDLHEFACAHSPVIVVGWSLGALEVLQAIQRFGPYPFSGVVLVDSSIGEEPAPAPGTAFTDSLRADRRAALDGFMHAIFRRPPPEPEVQALVDGALRMGLEQSIALFPRHLPREHWRDIARGLQMPLLYAVTEQYAEQAANLRAHRSRTRIEVFQNAGHALFVDQPDRFNRLMIAFSRSLA